MFTSEPVGFADITAQSLPLKFGGELLAFIHSRALLKKRAWLIK
jgi:hypothetical protein